jgi:hypothetical protein
MKRNVWNVFVHVILLRRATEFLFYIFGYKNRVFRSNFPEWLKVLYSAVFSVEVC